MAEYYIGNWSKAGYPKLQIGDRIEFIDRASNNYARKDVEDILSREYEFTVFEATHHYFYTIIGLIR